MTPVGQTVGPTTSGPWRLLFIVQRSIGMPSFIQIARGTFPIESFPYPDNGTFGDLSRSNGGSYDFGAMGTFVQHAKIYHYTDFHPNRTGGKFPIGSLPCPFPNFLFPNNLKFHIFFDNTLDDFDNT